MKRFVAAAALALGPSGTGVKAQSTPNPADQTGWETQARAAALMIPPNIQNLQNQKDALLPLAQVRTKIEGVSISAGPVKTPYDMGGKISTTVANADNSFALGAEIIKSPSFQSYFGALGFRVASDVTGTVTISAVSESAQKALANDAYTGNLEAQSASIRLDHGSAFVRWLHENGKSRELDRSVSSSIRVSQSEFDTFLRETTTIEKNTKVTLWDAFSRDTVTVGQRFDVGDASVLTVQGGVTQDPYATRAVAGATLDTYHGTWKSTIGAYSSPGVRSISAGISGKISNQLNWETRLSHTLASPSSSANTMAYVGIRYEFGGKSFTRPSSDRTPNARQALDTAMNDPILRPRPSSLGRVEITETTETIQTSRDINKTPQPIQASSIQAVINDDATVSVAIANSRTGWMYEYQLDGGSWNTISGSSFRTGALSTGIHKIGVREKHPQSNEVGPITEVSPTLQTDTPTNTTTQSVTVTSTTATIPLSLSDTDGIKDYTCQAYSGSTPIGSPVSATGTSCTVTGLAPSTGYVFVEKALIAQKKPNGNIVWVATEKRTSFTTDAPANAPGTISAPTLESKTSNSINTAPGAVVGMTNIRVALYSDPSLTNKIAENVSGDFTGLSANTTYYTVTIGDDLNENTGVTETKKSSTLTVTTDAPPVVVPTVPSNIPTSFVVNSDSGSINLSTYMQAGWAIQVVSVADPGAANGAGAPNVSVNGSTVNISVPTFYGTYDIPLTLRFTNSAGNSSNFVITAIGLSS